MNISNPDEINISDDEDDLSGMNSTKGISTPANTSTPACRRYPWLHDNPSDDELDFPSPNNNGRIVEKTVAPDNELSFTEVQKSLEFVESGTRPSVESCDRSCDKSCDISQSVVTNPEELCIDEDDEGSLEREGEAKRETGEGERGDGGGQRKDNSELVTTTEARERNQKPLVIKRRNLTIYQSRDDV